MNRKVFLFFASLVFLAACQTGDVNEGVATAQSFVATAEAAWEPEDLPDGIPDYWAGVRVPDEFNGATAGLLAKDGPDENGWSRELWLNPTGSLTWKWLNNGNLIHSFTPKNGKCYQVENASTFIVANVTSAGLVNENERWDYSVKSCPFGNMPD